MSLMGLRQPQPIDKAVQSRKRRLKRSKRNCVARSFPVDPLVAQLREELLVNFGKAGWADIASRLRARLRELDSKNEDTHDN